MIFDSSAVLAFLNQEPGWEQIESFLMQAETCCISAINLSEVICKLSDWGMDEKTAQDVAQKLSLKVIPFTMEHAQQSAQLRAITKPYGISLGDRACLALAKSLGQPVLTGDRIWSELADRLQLDVMIFRPAAH